MTKNKIGILVSPSNQVEPFVTDNRGDEEKAVNSLYPQEIYEGLSLSYFLLPKLSTILHCRVPNSAYYP